VWFVNSVFVKKTNGKMKTAHVIIVLIVPTALVFFLLVPLPAILSALLLVVILVVNVVHPTATVPNVMMDFI
jgi:flagellar biosynthesis component FlhA